MLTGRPARVFVNRIVREVGPLATDVAAALCRELPAGELTMKLAAEALQRLDALSRDAPGLVCSRGRAQGLR